MKAIRILLVLALFACIALVTNAQGKRIYAGLKAGFGVPHLSAGSVSTPLSEGYTSRLGFYSGIVTEYQSDGRFGMRIEINYSSQGGVRTGMQALPVPDEMQPLWQQLPLFGIKTTPYMYANIRSDAILNYLEIPVMGKFTFNMSPRLNLYVQGGPYLGVRIHAKNITSGSSNIYVDKDGDLPVDAILILAEQPTLGAVSFNNSEDITSDIHRFNIGAQGAVGFGLMIGSGKIFIEAGGNYGFIPVQIDKANGSNNTGAGTLTFGYMFEI